MRDGLLALLEENPGPNLHALYVRFAEALQFLDGARHEARDVPVLPEILDHLRSFFLGSDSDD